MSETREGLTLRQRGVLRFIQTEIERRGAPPTVREIGQAFAIGGTNGVVCHLRALERKGYIRRSKLKARGIEVVGQHDELLTLLREARAAIHPACATENGVLTVRLAAQIAKLQQLRKGKHV